MTIADNQPLYDSEDLKRLRAARFERFGKWLLPVVVMIAMIWLWDRVVVWNEIPLLSCHARVWFCRR